MKNQRDIKSNKGSFADDPDVGYMPFLQTPFGIFAGVERVIRYESGEISDIFLGERNVVMTHAGDLVPFYLEETPRRKYKSSVSFYPSGTVKSVYLEEQQEVETPIGPLPAEFVTFYDTGELKRVFILDGKLSGFWSETDERGLNIPLSFEFTFGSFNAMLVGLCFFRSGAIRSVTLFPGENIELNAGIYGKIPVHYGFSLYESGELQSFEPAEQIMVKTPIGELIAFDASASGVNADSCSFVLDREGRVISVVTSSDKIMVSCPDKPLEIYSPVINFCPESSNGVGAEEDEYIDPYGIEEDEKIEPTLIPLRVDFDYTAGTVTIKGEKENIYNLTSCGFKIMRGGLPQSGCSPDMCASCKSCPSHTS
jgi:hypothetical protein